MPFMKSIPLLTATCGLLLLAAPARAGLDDHTLDIYWNDVEGGGATLIVTPAGESILIDSGSPGNRDSVRIHDTAVKVAGVKKIDFYLQTHFHGDHIGGIPELAQMMPIGQVYERTIPDHDPDGGGAAADGKWQLSSKAYRTFPADQRNHLQAGTVIPLKAVPGPGALPLSLHCVGADQKFIAAPAGAPKNPLADQIVFHDTNVLPPTDNDNSATFVLDFGPFRFWDGGDITWNMEGKIVTPVNLVGQVDVYQVDHHGLAFSNNPVLIHSLAPTVSVMNNGSSKGTEKSTVEGLKSSPGIQAMYQVHKDLRPDHLANNTADEYCANLVATMRPPTTPGNIIKLSVAPDGKSYTITLPATGFTKTYQTRLSKEGPMGQK
jgi:beta-lactamase superfamily II metal-dependent hydrolase